MNTARWLSDDMREFDREMNKHLENLNQITSPQQELALNSLFVNPRNYRYDVNAYCQKKEQLRQCLKDAETLRLYFPPWDVGDAIERLHGLEEKLSEKRQLGIKTLDKELHRTTQEYFINNQENHLQPYKKIVLSFQRLYDLLGSFEGVEKTQKYEQSIEELENKKIKNQGLWHKLFQRSGYSSKSQSL
jgi:hypothetical protein